MVKLSQIFFTSSSCSIDGKAKLALLAKPIIIVSLLVTLGAIGLRSLGKIENLELIVFNIMMRMRPEKGPDPRLLIVAITEEDLKNQKKWPISDQVLADLLEKLQKHQPTAIGLDIYRELPQPPGYEQFVTQINKPNVITIRNIDSQQKIGKPPSVSDNKVGFNDIAVDPDGIVRRNLLFASKKLYSFSMRLAILYLENQGIKPKHSSINKDYLQLQKTLFIPLDTNSGAYANIDNRGYQILINYRNGFKIAQQVTMTKVINEEFDPNLVKNRIVLIGSTAPSLKDIFFTPYSTIENENNKISGIELHAQMTSQILSTVLDNQPLFWFWPEWGEIIWIGLWTYLGAVLAWKTKRLLYFAIIWGIEITILCSITFIIFLLAGWIPLVTPTLALFISSAIVLLYKLRQDTLHDQLTGLPNRELLLQKLQKITNLAKNKTDYLFALFFLDLDDFKTINNSLGHDLGDELLTKISHRLQMCMLWEETTVARLGGDEFAIIIGNIQNINQVENLAKEIQQALTSPFTIKNQEIFITVSIGITIGTSNQISEENNIDLLRNAHTAMYRAKDLGKNRYQIFAREMHNGATARLQLINDLRKAVEMQEFLLYYQPLVCLKTGQIRGFEALVRWQHPQRGLIPPGNFITLAEETGLIIPLGAWVFEEACRQMREWHLKFSNHQPLMISVNLSGKQFSQADLIDQIKQVLAETKLDARYLKLEITESVVMDDVEKAILMLKELQALNVQLGMDDFGTGYSSLSHLHRFPTDILKIDRSFVNRMGDSTENVEIVRTIIALAHNLGMEVIAEGIETAEQLAQLRALECEYGQGYFFSKPVDSKTAEALIIQNPTW